MTKLKLTAFSFIIFAFSIIAVSCVKNRDEAEQKNTFSKTLTLSGANEVPANASTATGTVEVTYSKLSKTLTYKVTWSGLTDSLSLMHIHGLAPAGFNASPVQNIVATSLSIFAQKTSGKFTFAKSGTLSGTLFVDGVAVKEADLLSGMYYLNIHTATYPGGEIRAQIIF